MLSILARYVERGDEALRDYVNRLSREVLESTVVLFGSRARGDYLPSGDYDVAVIMRDVVNERGVMLWLRS
ncbi:nucleotidyltransferase domain-containing protein [Vulcanisaeta thermophila]|uniref:nucleotidyltransferase domain-containing protein n=1 Tax=Vulcanisaeta thermophila TaxID=867917 RepID=UPI000853516B|nr:nucleotidyltransferase domain-containing protein [Vulcanisaeta thermophila]